MNMDVLSIINSNRPDSVGKISAFELLGLMEDSVSLRDIKTAFHNKSRLHHPDAGGKVEDFLNLKRAYDILSHPLKRETMGSVPLFRRPLLRIKPSMSRATSQLFENLSVLQGQIKKKSAAGGGNA